MLKVSITRPDEKDFAGSDFDMSDRTKLVFGDKESNLGYLYVKNSDLERWGLEYIGANSKMEYSKVLEKYVVTIDDAPYQNDIKRNPHMIIELDYCFDKDSGAESVYLRRDNKKNIIRQNGNANCLPRYCACNVSNSYMEADCPLKPNIEIKAYRDGQLKYHEYMTCLSSGDFVAIPVMTHNEYKQLISERVNKVYKGEISWEDYFDRSYAHILDYNLERFNLSEENRKTINACFDEEKENTEDMIFLKGFSQDCTGYKEAARLGLNSRAGGYSGYYVNDSKFMTMSYAEGDLYLKIYTDKARYLEEVERLKNFYKEG